MKAVILCNGPITDYESCKQRLKQTDKIICADGGVRHAYQMQILPDIIIGDLDSSKDEHLEAFINKNVPIIKYDPIKDMTDTHICMEYALQHYDEVLLLGATGSRLDHTLGNISILKLAADMGKTACIADEQNEVYVIKDEIILHGNEDDLVSLLPLSSKVEGITITGVHYPLQEAVMEIGNPYGVSNRFKDKTIKLSIKSGYMIVIKSKD